MKQAIWAVLELGWVIVAFFAVYGGMWWVWHHFSPQLFPSLNPSILNVGFWQFALIVISIRWFIRIVTRR